MAALHADPGKRRKNVNLNAYYQIVPPISGSRVPAFPSRAIINRYGHTSALGATSRFRGCFSGGDPSGSPPHIAKVNALARVSARCSTLSSRRPLSPTPGSSGSPPFFLCDPCGRIAAGRGAMIGMEFCAIGSRSAHSIRIVASCGGDRTLWL
jgi:hypothetical protein